MARPSAEKVGRGPCPSCGAMLTFRRSAGGLLAHKCDTCDSSGYCEPGGIAHAARMASMTASAAPAAAEPAKAAPPAAAPPTPPAAAKKAANSVFSLADL